MSGTSMMLRDRLIVGLDVPDVAQAVAMVARLGDTVGFYKIGMELVYGGGLPLVERLVGEGKKVFVDLKLHDIPNTVEKATAQIAKLGATFLTVHGFRPTMRAAKAGAAGSGLKLLAVTVLTSFDDADLQSEGYRANVPELVALRALAAREIGIDGIILSPNEVAAMRARLGADMILVTPGIRPAGAALGDQKRVMTPSEALRAGADHLVVARPIVAAPNPRAAALQILEEMAQA
ncbi:MAG: orotidine-5'-phosphate decarboxylase [Hyphomicrobiales bacterium]|nr:orotidine-5'-phosphate decarboxylase [Hyphomicrobiales bacterium]MDE2115101.1 orotidine-5'-phosphate decarboxylase [Hyphomicrobiales bacterium]